MIWLKMEIKLMKSVKYDVKSVKLMVLPGKVQGLETMTKTRLQTTATIQPRGYASLMKVSSGNNCAILQLLWVFCYFQTFYGFQLQKKCFTK
jgi:hypothetical protein